MFGCTCYIGVSEISSDTGHLRKQKDDATTVLVNRFAYPELRCFYTGDYPAQYVTGEIDIAEKNGFINTIQSADIKKVTDWIRQFFLRKNHIINQNPQIIVTYYFLIFELLNNEIYEISTTQENKAFVRNKGILMYENSRSREDLINNLCSIAEDLMENCVSLRKSNASIYIQQAKDYLDNHYSSDISLDTVAEQLRITPSHLSSIFKKEVGIGFSQYLTNVRITEAKKLLRSSKYNLNEVANAVGYNDANYFSSLFKKETKITPSEFRRLHQLKIGE